MTTYYCRLSPLRRWYDDNNHTVTSLTRHNISHGVSGETKTINDRARQRYLFVPHKKKKRRHLKIAPIAAPTGYH